MKLTPRKPKAWGNYSRPLPPPPLISSNLDELYETWRRSGKEATKRKVKK